MAREAFKLWSDVTGIAFVEVTSGPAQIVFTDDLNEYSTSGSWSGGIISQMYINIAPGEGLPLDFPLCSRNSPTDRPRAPGSAHPSDYNANDGGGPHLSRRRDFRERCDGPVDHVLFQRIFEHPLPDRASLTRARTADAGRHPGGPARTSLASSTTTRTGDTVYGFNYTSGRASSTPASFPGVGYTIYDNGGIDTLDYSGFSNAQTIDLTEEHHSNVGGRSGNVWFARGTVIERAIGGLGADELIGNISGELAHAATAIRN